MLCEKIDNFIRDRITVADRVIVNYGLQKIQDGDVILTYARFLYKIFFFNSSVLVTNSILFIKTKVIGCTGIIVRGSHKRNTIQSNRCGFKAKTRR